jgi:hypothetical protein
MGTQEISTKKDITIYPNPTQDVFNLSNIDHVKTIKITDSSSRLVKTINNPTITIRISELNSGIYFAELLLKDGTTKTIKIIKN